MKQEKHNRNQDFSDIWSYRPNARFGIFRKVLFSFLALTLIPIVILGLYTLNIISDVGDEMAERTTNSLNQKIRDALELQAVLTAKSLTVFLNECNKDLETLSQLPRDANIYLRFAKQNRSEVWIRGGTNKNPNEQKIFIPLYKEVALIDSRGNERIKIRNGHLLAASRLKNVSNPKNTTYRSERYFLEARRLKAGEMYVSHLNGFHVSKPEQLVGAIKIEDAVEGHRYDGVIRLAMPVYQDGKLKAVVMLGLDHRHLMEFTQHILPNQKETTVFPSYMSGNYAFMFDDQGWIITHPKYWDIRGVDRNGKLVPAYTRYSTQEEIDKGLIPFNLDSASFIHDNYPFVSKKVRMRLSGSVITTNVGGITKIMAYAPVFYDKGVYKKYGIFGGITVGAEIKNFQMPAFYIGNSMRNAVIMVRENLMRILVATLLFSIVLSWIISRNITNPVLTIMRGARDLAMGKLNKNIQVSRNDEIGVLAMVFNFMAYELRKSRNELLESYNKLKDSKSEVEKYAEGLEYQLKILNSIQRISNLLGSTLDMNVVIRLILQNCVEGVGFDRAILYLLDEEDQYLECKETFGFSEEGENLARRSKYHLEHFDCIETRVAKQGKIVFIENFKEYKQATALDRKIRIYGKSNTFVFIPLKVKEKIIGILGADKLRTEEPITQSDINSLQILANQAARVIENTRLYQEIVRQHKFVEDVLRYMNNGVLTLGSDGRITSVNRAALSILSLNKKGIEGKIVWDLFPNQYSLLQKIKDRLDQRGLYRGYNLIYSKADKQRYLNINASRIGSQDASIIIVEDVSERKKLDDHMKGVERLASLGRFAAGLAHELRNPLTGVSLLLDDLHDKLSKEPDIAKMLAMALDEIERLEHLTNEILDYANPGKGNYKTYNLNKLVESILPFIDKHCRQAGIMVHMDLAATLQSTWLNPDKIRQAILNILINAIQAMPTGGNLWVTTGADGAQASSAKENISDKKVSITISDDGPGIAPEDRDKIFEPFFTKGKEGTGLGLSTTQSIIEEHGGKIELHSGNKGTSFIILLPLRLPEEKNLKNKDKA